MSRLPATGLTVLLAALCGALGAGAQAPDDDWRTLSTERFLVHYPNAYEAWARHAASRLEAIAGGLAAEVGFDPSGPIEVLVMDPLAEANGFAVARLGAARMVLWSSPPDPESVLAHNGDWIDELLIHEQAHLAHLLRPSRNPFRRLLAILVPVGPIPFAAPRWVREGYATLLEGQLTGYGRPFSELRASVLREWARQGRLPEYRKLSADRQSWWGMSMAYLVGSAYLEWLRERSGEDSLRHLWARMTARRPRSFEEAFRGVFGDPPERLYDRFRAELTAAALAIEARLEVRSGELWQDLSWTTGPPAVSPDGDHLAVVLRHREAPAELVVWSTGSDEDPEAGERQRISRRLERDPEDVPAVRSRPPPRRVEHRLAAGDRAGFLSPRWTADGAAILHVRFEPDADGFLHPDLFLWQLAAGRVRRLTRGADLRHADPSPTGGWAVAVRYRHGWSSLVRVDLGSGAVEDLVAPSLTRVVAQPRISPDGRQLVYVLREGGRWQLMHRRLDSDQERRLPLPPDTTVVAFPEWRDDDSVYVVLGRRGFLEIYAVGLSAAAPVRRITGSLGASLAPAASPDGSDLYFLSLEVDGFDLRRIDPDAAAAPAELPAGQLASPSRPAQPVAATPTTPPPARRYRLGRQQWGLLAGGMVAPAASSLEVGVRWGDLVGRMETVLLAALGSRGGAEGAALATVYRGLPVEISLRLYGFEERISEQSTTVPGLGEGLDSERRGGELAGRWHRHWRDTRLGVEAGALEERLSGPPEVDRSLVYGGLDLAYQRTFEWLRAGISMRGVVASGHTADSSFRLSGFDAEGTLDAGPALLRLGWSRHRSRGAAFAIDQIAVGGLRSSLSGLTQSLQRIEVPALPAGILLGAEHEGRAVSLQLGDWPLAVFWEQHRIWEHGHRGDWLDVAGVELRRRSAALPLVGLPAFDLRLGAAVLVDPPLAALDGAIEGWLGLAWHR